MENLIENNKLLAEFVGGKYKSQTNIPMYDNEIWLPYFGVCDFTTTEIGKGKILKFHKDWNWLMKVVEKIEENIFVDEFRIKKCSVYGVIVRITSSKENTFTWFGSESEYNTKIEAVYNACVDFVKWYNQQNK